MSEAAKLLEDARQRPAHFHEFGFTKAAALPDKDVAAAYMNAFAADPVNGFRHGAHIKNRAFAGRCFTQAAAVAPASAFADFESYAYVLPRNPLYDIADDDQFARTARQQIVNGIQDALAQATERRDSGRIAELQARNVDAILQKSSEDRIAYRAEQRLYDWAQDVLLAAAKASPQAARTYAYVWKDLPFAPKIQQAIQSVERPLPTGDDGASTPTRQWTKTAQRGNNAGVGRPAA